MIIITLFNIGLSADSFIQLFKYEYQGSWKASESEVQYDFFRMSQGNAAAHFYVNYSDTQFGIQLSLLDPKYIDDKKANVFVKLKGIFRQTGPNLNFSGNSIIQLRDDFKLIQKLQCPTLTQMHYELINQTLKISINSQSCKLNIQIQLVKKGSGNSFRLLAFLIYMAIPVFATISFLQWTLNNLLSNTTEASRFSTTTIFLIIYMMIWLSLVFVYTGISIMNGSSIGLPIMFLGALWFLIGVGQAMKLVILVWRSSLGNLTQNQIKRQILIFYLRFYAGCFTYLVLMSKYYYDPFFLLLNSLYLVPQIIHNALKGNGTGFYPMFIFGVYAINLLVPIYFRGCPQNIQLLKPIPWFVVCTIISISVQSVILFIQHKFGPRFFVPRCFIPNYYSYDKDQTLQLQNALMEDCVICMTPLTRKTTGQGKIKRRIWITPCQHKFHPQCLREWLDVKLQCPYCRHELPVP